ncbi:MAG: sigma-54 dependent transcriptional regulator [Myxococcota bacterium]
MTEQATILVIDSDPGIKGDFASGSSQFDYRIELVRDGSAGLEALEANLPDLIILNAELPGASSGLATLRCIKQRAPGMPVIVLSDESSTRTIVEGMHLGATDVLRKPLKTEELDSTFRKILDDRALNDEVKSLRSRVRGESDVLEMAGDSGQMRKVRAIVDLVADTDVNLLIRGESGTGKEVVARVLHQLSPRRNRPFVKVDCAALPTALLERVLFGFEEGTFPDVQEDRLGKLERAHHGTLFLHEISEMANELRVKVLRVRREGEFLRLGEAHPVRVNTRVIATLNGRLEEAIRNPDYNEVLYNRFNVMTISLPPLRDRSETIPLFIEQFLQRYNQQYGKSLGKLSATTIKSLMSYHWPGNIRELKNLIRRMVVLESEDLALQELAQSPPLNSLSLDKEALNFANGEILDLKAISKRASQIAEKKVIERVLGETRWKRKEAAERLQISYKALLYKMKENGLSEGR